MKKIFLLITIIAVAVGLRFYKLGEVPVSPDWDEVALGYNAYSILKTGMDEYGTKFPLSIRSFDDYKPPLYVYLTVPSVAMFGLSAWSTRLPSAVMGVLAVIGVYFLVRELFRKSLLTSHFSLLTSLLLAISPWHIQFSRIAFEANSGITLNIWAVAAFLAGLRKHIFFPVSAVLFGLGFYAYHSERVFIPLLIILLACFYRKELFVKANSISLITSIIIGILVIAPLIPVVFNQTALMRLRGTSSFTDQTNLLARNIKKIEDDRARGDRLGELLDNRRIVYAKTVLSGYLSHFSLKWLFLTGDNPRHHAQDMGLLYLWEFPFLLFGIFMLFRNSKLEIRNLLIGWLLIAPVAAAPTTGLPHAIRTLVFLPIFQIITAMGIVSLMLRVTGYALRVKNAFHRLFVIFCVGCYILFILFNIAYYLDMYFIHQNPENSEYWQYGYKEAVALTEKLKGKYQKVIVSNGLEQSYMFFLFYTKYDPATYLSSGGTKSGSFEEANNAFDKYEFRKIDWPQERRDGTILYVGTLADMPHGNVGNIMFLNGKPAIELADQPNGAP